MTRRPSGGPGSNQYQQRGLPRGPQPGERREASPDEIRAAVTEPATTVTADVAEPEEVAWAFNPDRGAWEKAGFTNREAIDWAATGLAPRDAKWWQEQFTPEETIGWTGAGLTVVAASTFRRHIDPDEDGEFELWDTAVIVCESIGGVDVANDWAECGFDLPSAARWYTAGIEDPSTANGWVVNDFTVEAAVEWTKAGAPDPRTAHLCRLKGLTPATWTDASPEDDG